MLILAVDTSAVTASVALFEDEKEIAVFTINNKLTHSEKLLPMIENIFRFTGLDIKDVGLFCISDGPGSFTGLRIGISTVKGLAFSKNMPCAGVSTLEALAENLSIVNGIICPVMDARRSEYYNALFRAHNGVLERITSDRAISHEKLQAELEVYSEPVYICGDGTQVFFKLFDGEQHNVLCAPEHLIYQNASSVAKVGLRLHREGKSVSSKALSPDYLRLPQAERELNKK